MRLKASFTVENAIIIPLFTIFIVLFVQLGIFLHDKIIIRNAEMQAAMLLELEGTKFTEIQKKKMIQNTTEYINQKIILYTKDEVSLEQDIQQKVIIQSNCQPDFIRMVDAGLKLKE